MKNKISIKRKIVKIGNSYGIIFDKTLMEAFNLKLHDIVDISDINKILPKEDSNKKMLKEIKDEIDPVGTRRRNERR